MTTEQPNPAISRLAQPVPVLEDTAVSLLPGVTAATLQRLEKLGIRTLADLLLYLPSEWQDRTRITAIQDLQAGSPSQVEGRVSQVFQPPRGRRRMLSVQLDDGTGRLEMLFFHFSFAQVQRLKKGARVRCFGEVKSGRGSLRIIHPRYNILPDNEPPPLASHLTPLYPNSGGTRGQKQLEQMIAQCLQFAENPEALADPVSALLATEMPENLTDRLTDNSTETGPHLSLLDALRVLHQTPPDTPDLQTQRRRATERLALDELVADMLGQLEAGDKIRRLPAPAMDGDDALIATLLQTLPFSLTAAQQRVNAEIAADMQKPAPMLRLLQGDVGAGKTLIAICAALKAIGSGWQVALMAPTEVLVEQHLLTLRTWLAPLNIDAAALTASSSPGERRSILQALKQGDLQMVTGTHALFEDEVRFGKLGLVIVDEQHRFGVHQRLRLVERGQSLFCPHQLTMTATPIPRTLAMTRYAEMDVSILDEMPPGRRPVQTTQHPEKDRSRIIARIGERCARGDRVYWVCALIEESEQLKARAATLVADELRAALPQVSVGLIHGRMKAADKSAAIEQFKAGSTSLLVATTVIEVGMDVPEATMMVIENPERFGLAQLHQLRGRVGRSDQQSYCVLLHGSGMTEGAERRLAILCLHQDGFNIAEEDLRLRGPGELLGVRQAGEADYRLFDYQEHRALLLPAKGIARRLLGRNDDSTRRLQQRWLAHRLDYARV